jgi:hypothetical protein
VPLVAVCQVAVLFLLSARISEQTLVASILID